MNRYYLHIGFPKAGSSTLQHFLHKNRATLETKDIIYPDHELDKNGVSSGHMEMFSTPESFAKAIENLESRYSGKKIVLSNEDLIHHAKVFAALLVNVEALIVYIRRPDQWIASAYCQAVKRHNYTGSIEQFILEREFGQHSLFVHFLDEWSASVGMEKPIVRTLESSDLRDGDIRKDFLYLLGIDSYDDITFPKHAVNQSYSPECIKFKRAVNNLSYSAKLLDRPLQDYSDKIAEHHRRKFVLDKHHSDSLFDQFEPENLRLGTEFLGRKTAAFEASDPPDSPAASKGPNSKHDEILDILTFLRENYPDRWMFLTTEARHTTTDTILDDETANILKIIKEQKLSGWDRVTMPFYRFRLWRKFARKKDSRTQ